MSSVRLQFLAPGASVADAERGAAAAMLFLQRAGVSPEEAVAGDHARAMWGTAASPHCMRQRLSRSQLPRHWMGRLNLHSWSATGVGAHRSMQCCSWSDKQLRAPDPSLLCSAIKWDLKFAPLPSAWACHACLQRHDKRTDALGRKPSTSLSWIALGRATDV
jgi:hypothetical protein